MSSILNQINAYCVLLDERIDFWQKLSEDFMNHGIAIYPCIVGSKNLEQYVYMHHDINELPPRTITTNPYPNWVNKPNAYNAWLSHRKILEFAYQRKFEKIMIVEDDVAISDDFNEVMKDVDAYFANKHFDILQLGGYHHNNTHQVSSHIVKTTSSGGWHAVVIDQAIIPLLLSFQPIGPYDWTCEQFIQPKYECYCVYPGVINQKDGYSFVEGCNLTKPNRFSLGE